jgi:ribose transport system permease protein
MAEFNSATTVGKAERVRELMRTVGMLPVLVLLLVGFALASENFMTLQNLSIITQQASVNVVLAAGMTFVILTAGIDLSVGAILAASAVVALQASMSPQFGMFGIAAGIGFGLLLGLVNGGLIAFMRLPPFIVTLGALTAMRGLARLLADDKTVFNPDLPFAFIGNDSILGVHGDGRADLFGGRQPGSGAIVGDQGVEGAVVRLRHVRRAGRARRGDERLAPVRRQWPATGAVL